MAHHIVERIGPALLTNLVALHVCVPRTNHFALFDAILSDPLSSLIQHRAPYLKYLSLEFGFRKETQSLRLWEVARDTSFPVLLHFKLKAYLLPPSEVLIALSHMPRLIQLVCCDRGSPNHRRAAKFLGKVSVLVPKLKILKTLWEFPFSGQSPTFAEAFPNLQALQIFGFNELKARRSWINDLSLLPPAVGPNFLIRWQTLWSAWLAGKFPATPGATKPLKPKELLNYLISIGFNPRKSDST